MDRYPVRPWADFCDTTQFAAPETLDRVPGNIEYWLSNYALVILACVLFAVLVGRPSPMIVGLGVAFIICGMHALFRKRSVANMTRYTLKKIIQSSGPR